MSLLEARHITKKYDGRTIISDINLHLEEGELVCLLGLSGSGKTTLFHVLSGLALPDEGRVFLNGQDITGRAGSVSYMLQKDLLLPHKRVIDNVSLPLVIKGKSKQEARKIADALFGEFGLAGCQMQYPSSLSGGMRQRAAFLRTYLSAAWSGDDSSIRHGAALLDEPFSALDTITKGQIHTWYLEVMQKINLSTIFITHDIDEAILLSDRIYLMTGAPGVIEHEMEILPARPRKADFNLTQEFLDDKRRIISILQQTQAGV